MLQKRKDEKENEENHKNPVAADYGSGTAGWFCGRAPHSASPGSSGTRGRVQHRAGGVLRHLPHCCRGHVVCGFGCSPTELGISAVDFPVQAAFFLFLYPRTFVSIGPVLEVEMSSRQW